MLQEALGSGEAVERFLREARAAVKLRSEHVARVSDVGTLDTGAPYIVMEYLDGSDLSVVLAERGPMPSEMAVEFILQACDALAEAHALGIVHRDMKPANLFLTHRKDGTPLVKVLDFGISKSSTLNEQGAGSLTKTGGIMGSPLYMSPEQMKSAKDTDARTDIWALGVILFELVGGRTPFDSDTIGGLMAQVLTEQPPLLFTVREGLPPGLSEVIARCLEKDRNLRWPTVAHLTAALAPYAPARAQVLVERIAIVLGQRGSIPPAGGVGGVGQGTYAGGATAPGAMTAGGGVGTSPGWGATGNHPAPSGGTFAAIAFASVVGLAALGGGGFLAYQHLNADPAATAPTAPTGTPQTAASQPASQPSASAATAGDPSAAAPPATGSAAAAVDPSASAVPTALAKTAPVTAIKPPTTAVIPTPPASPSPTPPANPPTPQHHAAPKPPPRGSGLFDTSN